MSGKVWETDMVKRVFFFSLYLSVIQYFFLIGGTLFNIITKQWLYFPELYNISLLLIPLIHRLLYLLILYPYLAPPPSGSLFL